jgi:hypothetical protein
MFYILKPSGGMQKIRGEGKYYATTIFIIAKMLIRAVD